jgi:predicted transcriptional regulator
MREWWRERRGVAYAATASFTGADSEWLSRPEMPSHTRDILVSAQPKFASKIIEGAKTVELRRKFPETTATGAFALIYCSSPVRAAVGYARIHGVFRLPIFRLWREHGGAACVSRKEFDDYFRGQKYGFAILLEKIKLLNPQVAAAVLEQEFGIVPPQSYRYLHKDCISLLSDGRVQTAHRHKRRNRA